MLAESKMLPPDIAFRCLASCLPNLHSAYFPPTFPVHSFISLSSLLLSSPSLSFPLLSLSSLSSPSHHSPLALPNLSIFGCFRVFAAKNSFPQPHFHPVPVEKQARHPVTGNPPRTLPKGSRHPQTPPSPTPTHSCCTTQTPPQA